MTCCLIDLRNCFAADIGHNESPVVDFFYRFLLQNLEERSGRKLLQLWIDWTKRCARAHDDLVSSQGDRCPAGHCIMRHEYCGLRFAIADCACDLHGSEYQVPRCVQADVERNFLVSQTDGTKYFLGIVHVD